jgi:Subtilase family
MNVYMPHLKMSLLFSSIFFWSSAYSQIKNNILIISQMPDRKYNIENMHIVGFDTSGYIVKLAHEIANNLKQDLSKNSIRDTQTISEMYFNLGCLSFITNHDDQEFQHYLIQARKHAKKGNERILKGFDVDIMLYMYSCLKMNRTSCEQLGADYFSKILDTVPFIECEQYIESAYTYWSKQFNPKIYEQSFSSIANEKRVDESSVVKFLIGYLQYKYCYTHKSFFIQFIEDWRERKKPKQATENFWENRSVKLNPSDSLHSVDIAIWDTGVDIHVFPKDQLWINPEEIKDGADNDGNNFIDDIHGISIDTDMRNDTSLLLEMPDTTSPYYSKAQSTQYIHGTHVAGIALMGNPFARLMVLHQNLNKRNKKAEYAFSSKDYFIKLARSTEAIGEYIRIKQPEIVNMSWGGPGRSQILKSIKRDKKIEFKNYDSITIFINDSLRSAIHTSIQHAPNTLFIASAGNSNEDPHFNERFPAGFDLPNLLVVGAVDNYGKMTSFSNIGPGVKVYANGYEVESFVPGGTREKHSGTSMAAPQVANLAGKILALKPHLTTEEVIDLIIRHSDRTEENILIINPKKTIEGLR